MDPANVLSNLGPKIVNLIGETEEDGLILAVGMSTPTHAAWQRRKFVIQVGHWKI